jgi:glycosyltransferase involved in cell wall biosynthesis
MSADAVGGVWVYALELARGLGRLGIDVHLAVLGPEPTTSQRREAGLIRHLELIVTGLPLDWTARDEAALSETPKALHALALARGVGTVHLNAPAHAGGAPWPLPLVVAAHSCVATWWRSIKQGPLPPDLAWRARCTAAGIAVADAVIVPSLSFARALTQAYGAGLPVVAVPNGRQHAIGGLWQAKDRILTAGRLWDPAKDIASIDAAAAIADVAIHAAGPLRGPNGERAVLPHLAKLGPLDSEELARWYAAAAMFVSASRYEPFGLAVLEAAQAGAALVLSDIETFRELWDGAALFFPPGDACALANILRRLQSKPSLRGQFTARAKARAGHWSADQMIAATLSVYAQALRARPGRQPPRSAA